MSEEETEVEEINTAPGLLLAYAPAEDESPSKEIVEETNPMIPSLV